MIISFSGTSASGKSTIIAEIIKSGIFNGKKVVVKEEDSFLTIKVLKILLGENVFNKYKEEKFFKKRFNGILFRLFSAFSYIFYPVAVYVEFLTDYIWYQIFNKNSILLEDRYIYDYSVTFKNVLNINNLIVKWLYSHFPRPNLAFLIDIDLSIALKRNKNNIPGKITVKESFHRNVLKHYLEIAQEHRLLVVKNNNNLADKVKYICTIIINKEKFNKTKRIVICGLDGTGKTTVANMLAEYLNHLNIKSAVVHFYHENLLFKLLREIGFYRTNESKSLLLRKSRERAARERLGKTPFVLALLRFLDSYIQYLYFVIINKDKVIIFDRYFYDYLVSFEYLNIRWRSYFAKFIPEVESKFVFESLPMTSYKRKPESVKEFFHENYGIYLKIAKEHNMKIIRTDNKTPAKIMNEVLVNIN